MKWPVLGHLPYLSTNLSENSSIIKKYAEKHGSICQVTLGQFDVILLTDYHQIKRAFCSGDFIDRPNIYLYERMTRGSFQGVALSSGQLWQEHRQFAVRQLRELGVGSSRIEFVVQQTTDSFIQELKRRSFDNGDKAVDIVNIIDFSIMSLIWNMITGKYI